MRKNKGLTLVEILVALLIFGIVATVATAGISSALRAQTVNEAAASSQARLRRIMEVFTQELRSAVLGGITNDPYTSDGTQISFLLLDGATGYQVLLENENNNSFVNSNNLTINAAAEEAVELGLQGHDALLINGNGDAIVFPVGNVQRIGSPGSHRFNVVHPKCANTINFTTGTTMLFRVRTLGLAFTPEDATLYQQEGSGDAVPLAFDLTDLRLEYVYSTPDGTPLTLAAPLTDGAGGVLRSGMHGGNPVSLARVQVTVAAEAASSGGRTVGRSYTGQVELASSSDFQINRVIPCG